MTSIHFGNNPLNNNHKTKSQLTSLFPKGWAFFTKSSREPQFYIFDCNFSNPKLKNLRNFSSEYYFGMSRKSRILNIEINTIFQKIIEDSIKKTIVKTSEINLVPKELRGKIHYQKIMINKDIIPSFKGKYLFVSQTMLPWNILKRKSDYPSSFTVYPIEIYQK
ncbi:SdpA family antimicrobial peptide system protein [Flavobacterium sp.]|uniref:SdpA family antimicrobial peptide system protein n=1 Tax=Flavobacterium sp. TaxID=239 RepID=UPI0031E1A153